jgi:hypothetical protein
MALIACNNQQSNPSARARRFLRGDTIKSAASAPKALSLSRTQPPEKSAARPRVTRTTTLCGKPANLHASRSARVELKRVCFLLLCVPLIPRGGSGDYMLSRCRAGSTPTNPFAARVLQQNVGKMALARI